MARGSGCYLFLLLGVAILQTISTVLRFRKVIRSEGTCSIGLGRALSAWVGIAFRCGVIYGFAQMRSDAAGRQEGVTALVTPIGHTVCT